MGTDSTYAAKLTEIKNAEKELADMKKQLAEAQTEAENLKNANRNLNKQIQDLLEDGQLTL